MLTRGWEPEPDSLTARGMEYQTAAADAAALILEATAFLRQEGSMHACDEEQFDKHWGVKRGQ